MTPRRPLRWHIQHWLENRLPGLLTCAEFEHFVDAYIDGDLGGVARAQVDFHVRTCPACQRYLSAYRKARDLAVDALSAEEDAALTELPEDLITAVLAARDAQAGRGGA